MFVQFSRINPKISKVAHISYLRIYSILSVTAGEFSSSLALNSEELQLKLLL